MRGGVLNAIVSPEPPNLNLALQTVSSTQMVSGKVYESLVVYSPKLEPMPGLARSWTVSADRLTYTFKLQTGVKWHDGKPFSSADVVFTYTKILSNTARTRPLMDNVAELSAPDASTVVFRLKQPNAAFLYAFDIGGGAILPRHLYDVETELAHNQHNNAPVGTGPFRFSKWDHGSSITLVRNPDYWRKGLPYLDGITYQVIPDAAARRLALERRQVQLAVADDIEPFDGTVLATMPHISVTLSGSEYWSPMFWVEMNQSLAPFNDKRFRQAVLHAVDRDFVASKIFFGRGTPSTGPIHHNTRFYDPNVQRYAFDPKEAARLLDEMGLKPDASGVRARVGLIPAPWGDVHKRFAEYFKVALGKVGILVNIESAEIGSWVSRMGNGDFQMVANGVFQYGDPAIGVARTYLSTNIRKGIAFSNTSQYKNPKVDALFNHAASAAPEQRQALYSEAQRLLVDDAAVAWILDTAQPIYTDRRVHDAITTALGASGSFAEAWLSK